MSIEGMTAIADAIDQLQEIIKLKHQSHDGEVLEIIEEIRQESEQLYPNAKKHPDLTNPTPEYIQEKIGALRDATLMIIGKVDSGNRTDDHLKNNFNNAVHLVRENAKILSALGR